MTDLSRRAVLATSAAAGVSGLSGCLDALVEGSEDDEGGDDGSEDPETDTGGTDPGTDDGEGTDEDETGEDETDGTDPKLEVIGVSTETVDSYCRTDDEESVETDIDGDTVDVSGVLLTPDPCHEARVSAEVTGETLTVTVRSEAPDDEDVGCGQCTGAIEYESSIELSDAGIETVEVIDGNDDAEGTGEKTEENEVTVAGVDTATTTCAGGDDSARATSTDGQLTIQGQIRAPNPCHEAVVSDLTAADDEVTVTVGVESTLGEDEMCQQCVGLVSYSVTLAGGNGQFEKPVRVVHGSNFSETVWPNE